LCDPSSIVEDATSITRLNYTCGQNSGLPNFNGVSELWIELVNCPKDVPLGFFTGVPNSLVKLVISAPYARNPSFTYLQTGTFEGLPGLVELQLRGFENIGNVDQNTLEPVRNLRCIYLEGFGLISASLSSLTSLLRGLSGTPLQSITLNGVIGVPTVKVNPIWNLSDIFAIQNVTVQSLNIENTDISSLTGLLSDSLPNLISLSISLQTPYDNFLYTFLDSLFLFKNLGSSRIYGYPSQIIANYDRNVFDKSSAPVKFSSIHRPNPNCLLDQMLVFSTNVTRLTINNFAFGDSTYLLWQLYETNDKRPMCFDESFKCEHLDMQGFRFPASLMLLVGLVHVKSFNLQNTQIRSFSDQQLSYLTKLEVLLLGNNDLGDMIASDSSSTTFSSGKLLTTLDLAQCRIINIPYQEFNSLVSLQYLNLSGNKIHSTDWQLTNCSQLLVLNLSNNSIEQLSMNFMSQYFMSQLTTILASSSRDPNSSTMDVDLSGNLLSCLCNATDFITWLQSVKGIRFVGYDQYKCLYPNGLTLVKNVQVSELSKLCEYLPTTLENNTACTCEKDKLNQLFEIRYALAQYYCTYPSGVSVQMSLLDPTMILGTCGTTWPSVQFIGGLVAGIAVLLIIITIVVFVVVYKRKRPVEYKRFVERLDINRLTGALMKVLAKRWSTTPDYEYDAFVAYHNDDWSKLRNDSVLSRLSKTGITIYTENENGIPGEDRLDQLLDTIAKCRHLVLVVSPSFASDDWCKCITQRAVRRLHAIVPLILIPINLEKSELTFNNILDMCKPIYWSDEPTQQEGILNEMKARLTVDFKHQIVDSLSD